ncbi:MAG TPA: hypothetical protein VFE69_00700, partial [Ilumatobacteraceae bacterium]|nr:hypothetical protein [Ilumatobacteraceae bacterium]
MVHRFVVHAPDAHHITIAVRRPGAVAATEAEMTRGEDGATWMAELDAVDGDLYWFVVDGVGPLLDPNAADVVSTDGGFRSVVRDTWPKQPSLGSHHADPVVYEVHVRGFGSTFDGCVQHLPYLADLGVDVIELMPVHPFDNSENYWGYMPLVWGAVHRPYAAGDDA